jgi:TrmH family RNA methyltransferase
MKQITSAQNPEIIAVAKLQQSKERAAQNKFTAEGVRTITTLIEGGYQPTALYCTQELADQAQKIVAEKTICLVNNAIMNKISQSSTPSGIVAVFPIPSKILWEKLSEGVVLAQISDPGNMGTLIRSAAAMGVKSVVIIEGTDPWSHKVIQSTAGTIAHVNIFQTNWPTLLKNKKNLTLCALVVAGGKKPERIATQKSLLIVGSEAHGLPQEWISDCDEKVTIPMPGNTESLNAGVAGSIALYLTFVP